MVFIISLLAQGCGLGFTAAVQPGPLQTYIMTQTLQHGWRRALPTIFAPLLSDGPIMLLTLFVLVQLPADVLRFMRIGGGVFILYLAWNTFHEIRRGASVNTAQPTGLEGREAGTFWRAVTINLLNPSVYIFWSTISGPIMVQAWKQAPASAIAFLFGFYAVIVSWNGITVALFHQARRLDDRLVKILLSASVLILAVFGILLLKSGLMG